MASQHGGCRVSHAPNFDEIFEVMAAASLGDAKARVHVPEEATADRTETRFAIALNILLDDLAARAAEVKDARFRALLEAAPDAIVLVALSGDIVFVNAQTERLFGYVKEELLGKRIEILMPSRFRVSHRRHRDVYFANARVRMMDPSLELKGLRKDGSEFPIEVSLSPIDAPEGRLVTAAVRDATLRKQTEVALKRANDQLEAFSYSVAHDLRSPLRAMSGYSQLLLESYSDKFDSEGAGWLRRIDENAQRMALLIEALLSLAQVNRTELKWEPVDLSEVFRASAAHLATTTQRGNVEVVIADGQIVEADAQLCRVLADNLLGNAWKFTADTPHPKVELGMTEVDDHPCYFVRDNGAGFDMAFAGKLFKPFQRLHTVNEFPGTGIGLATVASVVRRHGGRIWAESRVGQGATFFFTLQRGV